MTDPYGGGEQQEILLIENQKALKAFFAKVNRTRKPGLQVPEVDFEKDMVIIYFSGQTTQEELPLLSVEELKDEQLLISVSEREALKESSTNTAVLEPFGLYTMAKTDKKVLLQKQ
ncbi:hypothetical protein PP178_14440 [Zeaxanthinibacter sp. PT1]|uniref:hypothetical protein n=1 Tax=Zeaxanthinibacter TaxID=561554 RepID=UPI00234B8099|nr:hypothetical protein [Zeaxanthinibacter sp. PT1]MDC6352757.1 hypothetical protein [Zeaxanthinibacter sp. PT1]